MCVQARTTHIQRCALVKVAEYEKHQVSQLCVPARHRGAAVTVAPARVRCVCVHPCKLGPVSRHGGTAASTAMRVCRSPSTHAPRSLTWFLLPWYQEGFPLYEEGDEADRAWVVLGSVPPRFLRILSQKILH